MYSSFGIPVEFVSDNGLPFISKEFKDFSIDLGFNHRRFTPNWPQANRAAESFMINLGKS